jgi:hypothetical protein
MKNQILNSCSEEIQEFRRTYPHYRAVLTQRFTKCESWLILAVDYRAFEVAPKPYYLCLWWHPERGIFKVLARGTREDCKKAWHKTRKHIAINVIDKAFKQMEGVLCKN